MHLPLQHRCRRTKAILLAGPKVGAQEQRLVECGGLRNARRLLIPKTPQAARGIDNLIKSWKIDDADHRLVIDLEPDEDAVQGNAVHKGIGAVNGIEDPATIRLPCLFPFFFAKDSVIRKSLADAFAQVTFGVAICNGYERVVGLAFGDEWSFEVVVRNRTGAACDVDSKVQQLFKLVLG